MKANSPVNPYPKSSYLSSYFAQFAGDKAGTERRIATMESIAAYEGGWHMLSTPERAEYECAKKALAALSCHISNGASF